jgi:hypothetical protein
LRVFLNFSGIPGDFMSQLDAFIEHAHSDPAWAYTLVDSFMGQQALRVKRGEVKASGVSNYLKAIKLFSKDNEIELDWKKLGRLLPTSGSAADDRAPSLDEVHLLLTYPDRRIKPVVLAMASGGFRVGAFEMMNCGHVQPIKVEGQIIAARVTVYAGTAAEYVTFITPEAYRAILEYIDYRQKQGEDISEASPLIRDLFAPDKGGKGIADVPRRLKSIGVKRLIEDGWRGSGIRSRLEKGKHRHEFPSANGFRRFFRANAERTMTSSHVKALMGGSATPKKRDQGPTEAELLKDYLKAVRNLTVLEYQGVRPEDEENAKELKRLREDYLRLQREVEQLKNGISVGARKPPSATGIGG